MSSRLSPGASGAIRRVAGWVARGSVGHPLLDGINYWDELKDSPSQMETCFAIFANVLELDDHGEPVNEKTGQRAESPAHRTDQRAGFGVEAGGLDLRMSRPPRRLYLRASFHAAASTGSGSHMPSSERSTITSR